MRREQKKTNSENAVFVTAIFDILSIFSFIIGFIISFFLFFYKKN